jgi:chromosome segregation ATPase
VLLEEMSEAQRSRFETVQIDIYNLQDQIAEAFSRQENKMTAQLIVLKEASTGIANDTTAIQGRLERMEEGDEKLRTTMDEILKSGTAIQEKLTEVERLMESAFPGDGSVRSNELERARDALRQGYDLLAYHTFEKTEATLVSQLSVCECI